MLPPQGVERTTEDATMLTRVVLASTLVLAPVAGAQAGESAELPAVEVYGPAVCLACIDWTDHLRQHGFTASFKGTDDMAAVKQRLKVPADMESVHTAVVAGYFIEGHVPAEDIKLLLKERPEARGLAAPGLPIGAPGREQSAPFCERGCTILDDSAGENVVRRELFNVYVVGHDGKTSVWARH
jgi:hypothetical protein